MKLTQPRPTLSLPLPGPSRKREITDYRYRVLFKSPDISQVGCAVVWEVEGGRMPYQVALERTEQHELKWHCTCADAVYRCEGKRHRYCKHISGIMECLPTLS
ncbi:MAG: hypothetical protein ACRC8S_20530 [Fimbriiglobus sp.]